MALFRRRRPLHQQLAAAAGMALDAEAPAPAAHPPGWDARAPLAEPAVHGVPRPRRWDVVVPADAPLLRGDAAHFVALPDGTLVVEEDEPDDALGPVADAVEATLGPPYRAEAVRRGAETWVVGASRIAVAEVRGLEGEQVELTSAQGDRTLVVDGRPSLGRARELERLGEAAGADYVVRATRLDGDLFEVDATPL